MHRFIIAIALIGTIGIPRGMGDPPAPVAPLASTPLESPSVEKLIEQLGDRSFQNREAAARLLNQRGESVLPALQRALTTTHQAESRRRLQMLVTNLERSIALSARRVTLRAKGMPIQEAVASIAKQTGYVIRAQGDGLFGGKITCDLNDVTFWEAIDRVCLAGGYCITHNDNQIFTLYQQDNVWPHVSYHGPFKIAANNFHYSKQLTLGGLQRNPALNQVRTETLQFSFNILSEPKLPIMQVFPARVLAAFDERGESMKLPPANQHETYYHGNGGYRSFNQSSYVYLVWPDKNSHLVKRLRVSMPVQVLASQRPDITVDDILKVKEGKFSGTSVDLQVHEVKEQNNKTMFQIRLTARNTATNSNQDYTWTNSVHQRLELFDAKGNKYYPQGYNWENSTPTHVQAAFLFGTNGEPQFGPPVRLVYNHWALMHHEIEFEFADLPLP